MNGGIPDKLYLRIGEVSTITGLPASVLRYWESEFGSLAPKKSSTGQRLYTRRDIEQIAEIKQLLYAEKLTIEGARKRLAVRKRHQRPEQTTDRLATVIEDVKVELRNLRDLL
ncbi:MAG TPA: MerR family transcriptional regulator [Geomonas sp.]|nr:MerR family transcriptional regulator [Geomonas sp.]